MIETRTGFQYPQLHVTVQDDQIAETLIRARAILASGRWCKDVMEDRDGNVCAFGAIRNAARAVAMFSGASYSFAGLHASRRLASCIGRLDEGESTMGVIAVFNDADNTTLPMVLDMFDKALADLGALHEV